MSQIIHFVGIFNVSLCRFFGKFLPRAILKESFSSKSSEPGFPGSEKLWNRNFPEPGMRKYREIGRSRFPLPVRTGTKRN